MDEKYENASMNSEGNMPLQKTLASTGGLARGKRTLGNKSTQQARKGKTPSRLPNAPHATISPSQASSPRLPVYASRPYRSHKVPACSRCHQRRSRCTIEVLGQACLLCRLNNIQCSAASTKIGFGTKPSYLPKSMIGTTEMEDSSQVVGPVISRDTHVLESMMSSASSNEAGLLKLSTVNPSVHPIYRSTALRRRPSPPSHRSPVELVTELCDMVVEYRTHLISLYFEEIHPCFPLMEESQALVRFDESGSFNRLFLANFWAYMCFYLNLSQCHAEGTPPDQNLAWDAAVACMNESSQRCDILAITSAVLNIAGRPSIGGVHNTGNVARITAFSHSIGLNHDCSNWNLSQPEKSVRTKLWWAVVIHDRWFHFAHGTPPYVNKEYYDVSLPTMSMLIVGRENSERHRRAAECYIGLCQLTEIIGDVLPLIYHIRSGQDSHAGKQLKQTNGDFCKWLTTTPLWITCKDYGNRPHVPGLVNLQLSYLAVEMLLKRLWWHEKVQQNSSSIDSGLLACLEIGESIVEFLGTLRPLDLAGFWLPYNVHHFISAETLLLRCALQANSIDVQNRSITAARQLVYHLSLYHTKYHWDLAETALPQVEPILKKVEVAMRKQKQDPTWRQEDFGRKQSLKKFTTNEPTDDDALRGDPFDLDMRIDVEYMFPEIFAEFTEGAFWDQTFDDMT